VSKAHNTLFVTLQGAYVGHDHLNLEVRLEGETKLKVPLHHLSGVVCFGRVSVSPPALEACAKAGIGVALMTENGRFIGRFEGKVSGNVLLRRTQFRWADDDEKRLEIAKNFVLGKLANYRAVLSRAARDSDLPENAEALQTAASSIQFGLSQLNQVSDYNVLLGAEGNASATYFGVFDRLIRTDGFVFEKRTRRPPKNAVNAMLSFGYAMLSNDCISACEGVGLDPSVGFLHVDRPGRYSLALDLMEEFRPVLVDRLVLAFVNRRQVQPSDFVEKDGGGIEMSDSARKAFITAYQEKKREELKHPFTEENTTFGLLPHIQARLLARVMRGDLEGYPPFTIR
jgi:CRISPR-associated protein Cas1